MTSKKRRSFAFSAENPTGEPNGGTRGKDCEKLRSCRGIGAGETITILDTDGPGMITHMWFGGFISQHFIIRIYWDHSEFPSVEVPIASFFGYHYPMNLEDRHGKFPAFSSSEMMVAPCKGCNSYLQMPFQKHCRITIENRSTERKTHYWMITGWKGELEEDEVEYLHATFRQEHPVQAGRSYTLLDNIKGRGRLHGVTLGVGINGADCCWCEGEAKMWIDGERYPSINYTGTEDYFCGSYAFGYDSDRHEYQTYTGLYAGMYAILGNLKEPLYNGQQRFMLYRWHVKDPIYFDESFRMVIDNLGGYWDAVGKFQLDLRYDDYTSTTYYYMENPAPVPFELPTDEAVGRR